MKVPKLRFKNSAQKEWQENNLLGLSKSGFTNGVFNDPVKVGSGYKLINVLDMYIESTIDETKLSLISLNESEFKANKVNYGDIFFTRSSLVKAGIAFSNVYLGHSQDITFDGHLIRMCPKTDLVTPQFLNYLLKTSSVRKQLVMRGKTATMTTIGQADIATVSIFYPLIEEQTKIANFLTAIDKKITQLTQKCDLLAQYKKGVMQQIFSQKLRFKDDDGREFPEWENKKIGDIFKFKQGIQCSIENQFMEMDDSRVRFIRIVDLTNYQEPRRYIENPGSNYLLKPDELFMVRYGSPGLVGYGLEGAIANNLFRIIAINKDIIFSKFYFYFFSFFKNKILQLSSSSTMPALNFDSLGMLEITLLSLPEQTKIANFLTAIDDKITQAQAQLDAVKRYKKGLLQQMFV